MSEISSLLETLGGASGGIVAGAVSAFFVMKSKVDEHEKKLSAIKEDYDKKIDEVKKAHETALSSCKTSCSMQAASEEGHLSQRMDALEKRFERFDEKLDKILMSVARST